MEIAIKSLRIIWGALTAAILIYAYLASRAQVKASPLLIVFRAICFVAVLEIAALFFVRARLLSGTLDVLRTSPEDRPALAKWRSSYIVSWALSLSVSLYGLVLRYIGFEFRQAVAFFAVGFCLMLLLLPRRPDVVS